MRNLLRKKRIFKRLEKLNVQIFDYQDQGIPTTRLGRNKSKLLNRFNNIIQQHEPNNSLYG